MREFENKIVDGVDIYNPTEEYLEALKDYEKENPAHNERWIPMYKHDPSFLISNKMRFRKLPTVSTEDNGMGQIVKKYRAGRDVMAKK